MKFMINEGGNMGGKFVEENGVYQIDCSKAVWATDEIHEAYHKAGIQLKDCDFLVEDNELLYLIEYKNANINNAEKPDAFKPEEDKMLNKVVQKFYDSLHYLYLTEKKKPIEYIYILEYPKGDIVTRKRLRNKMKQRLPFELQNSIGMGKKLIEKVEVLSIEEWNTHEKYGIFPITQVATV